MKRVPPQNVSTRRVLTMLLAGPAPSGAALARQVGIKQPSIVRIIRDLESRGLIVRSGRSVALSDAGRTEARRIDRERSADISKSSLRIAAQEKARVSEALAAMAGSQDLFGAGVANALGGYNAITRDALFSSTLTDSLKQYDLAARDAMFWPDLTKSVNHIGNAALAAQGLSKLMAGADTKLKLGDAFSRMMAGIDTKVGFGQEFADLIAGMNTKLTVGQGLGDILAGMGPKFTVGGIYGDLIAGLPSMKFPNLVADIQALSAGVTKGMASTVAAQELAMSALTNTALSGSLYADVFADTTPILSRMIADLGVVTRAEGLGPDRRITAATDRLAQTHGRLFATSLDWLGPLGQPSEAARQIAWSTLAAGSGISAARAAVGGEEHDPVEEAVDKSLEVVALPLHEELAAIDPMLSSMLEGALEARERGGADWHRHMSQSLRTLMTEVLNLRAPRSVVKQRLGADDQRHRLQYVMGGKTAAAFAEGTIGMFVVTWNTLSAEAKTAKPPRFTRSGAIQVIAMYCHLLRLMLASPTLEEDDRPDQQH